MATVDDPSRNLLRRWRKRHKVTQAQLAADLGVHPSLVNKWETGSCAPTLERFEQLRQRTRLPAMHLLRFFVPSGRGADVVVEFPGRTRAETR